MKIILAFIYSIIINIRNWLYDKNLMRIVKPSIPVISVGNITVGGTGKTPMVILLTRLLMSNGFKPAIIGKGYKRKSKGKVIVRDEAGIKAKLLESGDEMMMIARKVRAPVIIHKTKTRAAIEAEKLFDIDSIIVDDGFQHRKLHRDIDIIMLDDSSIKELYILPKGRLREGFENIVRADVICFVGMANLNKEQMNLLRDNQIIIRVVGYFHNPYLLGSRKANNNFNPKKFYKELSIITAIASPERFINMLSRKGYYVKNNFLFQDHYDYTLDDIKNICRELVKGNNKWVATTEKDAVKLIKFKKEFITNNIKVIVFPLYFRIVQGGKPFINLLISKCKKQNEGIL